MCRHPALLHHPSQFFHHSSMVEWSSEHFLSRMHSFELSLFCVRSLLKWVIIIADLLQQGICSLNATCAYIRDLFFWGRYCFVVVLALSCVWFCATPWTAANQASWSFIISPSLLTLMSNELVMLSNHFICCHPLSLLFQSFPTSGSSQQVTKVMELQVQHQSFQWLSRVDFL